jgi:hypothetical protein
MGDELSGFPRTLPNVVGDEIRWVGSTEEEMKSRMRKKVTIGASVVG